MPSEFRLSPRTSNILRGRGMYKDGKLLCSASVCLYETEYKGFGREIEVKGETICPRCMTKVLYPDDLEDNPLKRVSILKCPSCKMILDKSLIVWTQKVVSKHRGKKKKKHVYFHKECYDAMFV